MKHASFFKLFGLVAAAFVGLMLGRYSPTSSAVSYSMSSETPASDSINSFKNLSCPSEEKYKELAARVSFEIPKGTPACDESHRAQMGKILLLMDQLKMDPPADWLPEMQGEFKDLLGYLAKNSRFMGLDLSQTTSIAYNQTTSQSIYIGGYFFDNYALEDISTLIHEARHSARTAQGHDQCIAGDIPLTVGGCDATFSTSLDSAGAYSFEVMLQVGLSLYGRNLSQGDREYLMSSALTVLTTRFNELPSELAAKNDVLLALDKNGKVYAVDIEKNLFKPVPVKLQHKNEKIQRVRFNARDSGAAFFTNMNHAYSWTFRRGARKILAESISPNLKISDAERIVIPGEVGRSRYSILTPEGAFQYIRLSAETLKSELKDVVSAEELKKYPKFVTYFLGGYGDSAYLTADGKVYLLDVMMRTTDAFKFPESIQDPQGWQAGTGGVTYSDMFLLNRAGQLKTIKSIFEEIDDNNSKTTYMLEDHPFATPSRAVKYFQGLKIHAALTENGRIYVRPYGSDTTVELSGPDIIDFTIIHNPVLSSKVVPPSK